MVLLLPSKNKIIFKKNTLQHLLKIDFRFCKMKHIDILLEFFATEQDQWNQTYIALLPYELLQKVFDLKRKQELLQITKVLRRHWLCRGRGFGKNFYNHTLFNYPYYSSNKIKIHHVVSINNHKLSIRVKFSKLRFEYSEMFSDRQYQLQRPHFTICSESLFFVNDATPYNTMHYQIQDWKYDTTRSKIGKCL